MSTIWFVVAAAVFAAAVLMTVQITSVSGRLPIGDARVGGDEPAQVLAIFAGHATTEFARPA